MPYLIGLEHEQQTQGQRAALHVFANRESFQNYRNTLAYQGSIKHDRRTLVGDPGLPAPHLALRFHHREALPPELAQEIAEHGWEVAGNDAHPWLFSNGDKPLLDPLTAKEICVLETVVLALTPGGGQCTVIATMAG